MECLVDRNITVVLTTLCSSFLFSLPLVKSIRRTGAEGADHYKTLARSTKTPLRKPLRRREETQSISPVQDVASQQPVERGTKRSAGLLCAGRAWFLGNLLLRSESSSSPPHYTSSPALCIEWGAAGRGREVPPEGRRRL